MIQATANIRYRFYEASTERERRPGPVGCRPCPDSAAPPDSGPRPAVRRRQSAPVAICHPITDPRRLWPPAGAAPARPRALWTETAACADRTRHGQTAAGAAPAKRLSLSVAPHGTESRSGVSRSGETHPVTEAEAARALIRQLFVFVYLMRRCCPHATAEFTLISAGPGPWFARPLFGEPYHRLRILGLWFMFMIISLLRNTPFN